MKFKFTTSWDDGSALDLKVADLLSTFKMKGTFYIPESFDGVGGKYSEYGRRLNEEEIRELSHSHELGGHSLTHRRLSTLSKEEARKEIVGSKIFLDNLTEVETKMFAPPGGEFNDSILELINDAAFVGVRTTKKLAVKLPEEGFLLDETIICQPFPFRKKDAKHYYWRSLLTPLNAYDPKQWAFSWQDLARNKFKEAYEQGNYFHLYGHSWEIEKYGMWEELESFLGFVSGYENVEHLTNGEIMESL